MNTECPFCTISASISTKIYTYSHWNLFLHSSEKRDAMRPAAGFIALRRHEPAVIDATPEEWIEAQRIISDAARRLCASVNRTYSEQEITGFNRGKEAGQTVEHAHIHILPIAKEDPDILKGRVGMSAAFEALTRERVR